VVPLTAVTYVYERWACPKLTPRRLVATFLGGGLSMLVAALVENWLLPSGSLRFLGFGLIEELAKAAMLAFVAARMRGIDARGGVVLGAAVGFGYDAFESSGYALNAYNGLMWPDWTASGLGNVLWIEAQRAVVAPVVHGLWTAILGGAILWAAASRRRLRAAAGLACATLLVVGLHAGWDASDTIARFVIAKAAVAGTYMSLAYSSVEVAVSLAVSLVGAAALVTVWRFAARSDVRLRRRSARRLSVAAGKRPGQLCPRRHLELPVGTAQVVLDGLRGDEERLCHLPVGATLGGEPGHSKLARGECVDTAQSRPARTRAREESLAPGALRDRDGAAPGGDLERLPERIPGFQRMAEAAKRGAQVELSPGWAATLGPRAEVRKVPRSPNDRVVVLKRVHPNFVAAVLAQQQEAQQQQAAAPAWPATPS
jgi:protease PrsW